MPDLAGRLYPSEKAALRRSAAVAAAKLAKEQAALVASTKPVGQAKAAKPGPISVHPLDERVYVGDRRCKVKLTPAAIEKLCADVRMGMPMESAVILAGVSRGAVDKWRQRNPAIEDKMAQAEREFEKAMVCKLHGHADKDPKVAQWLLERRLPQKWAPVAKTEHTGKDGGPILAMSIHKSLLSSVGQGTDPLSKAKRAEPASAAAA